MYLKWQGFDFEKQDYSPKEVISGVIIKHPRKFSDDGGHFLEIGRYSNHGGLDGVECFNIAQINYSKVLPGAIKALHLHNFQTDYWHVIDKAVVGLMDMRGGSPTRGVKMRIVTDNTSIFIPPGVAHGISNPYSHEVNMFYLVNRKFDVDNSDEYRLPYEGLEGKVFWLGKEFWEVQKG